MDNNQTSGNQKNRPNSPSKVNTGGGSSRQTSASRKASSGNSAASSAMRKAARKTANVNGAGREKNEKEFTSPNKRRMAAKEANKNRRYYVAVDPNGLPIVTTLRDNKDTSIRVLSQGSEERWSRYSKEGYRIREASDVFSRQSNTKG